VTDKDQSVYIKGKRHYPLSDGTLVPSVSTFLGVLPKPALEKWKIKQVAEAAVKYKPQWEALPEEAAIDLLTGGKLGSTKARDNGDTVHKILEDLFMGRQPDIPEGFERVVDVYERFTSDYEVKVLAVEPEVRSYSLLYAGSLDWIGWINGELVVLDWKSGAGLYGSTAYQLAAYAMADKIVINGEEQEMPQVAGTMGCWVRRAGYALYPMAYDDDIKTVVRAARALYDRVDKDWKYRGKPINPNPIRSKGQEW
jgi:hypothetical protein